MTKPLELVEKPVTNCHTLDAAVQHCPVSLKIYSLKSISES